MVATPFAQIARRLRFTPGSNTAEITGTIKNGQKARYVFGAQKGQQIYLGLNYQNKAVAFEVFDKDGKMLNEGATQNEFEMTASYRGDFWIEVTTSAKSSRYTLRLTIN